MKPASRMPEEQEAGEEGRPAEAVGPSDSGGRPFTVTGGRILNVSYQLDIRYGGLASAVPWHCAAVERYGIFSSPLVALIGKDEHRFSNLTREIDCQTLPIAKVRGLGDVRLALALKSVCARARVVHIHGIWSEHCAAAGWAARRSKRPYIVSVHGMLSDWALSVKGFRKRAYMTLVELHNLNRSACVHALTPAEAIQCRRQGISVPICVLPNGFAPPERLSRTLLDERFPLLQDKRIALFLGRLLPTKGVDLLVKAWPAVVSKYPDAHLVIAGPDPENNVAHLNRLIEELRVAESVSLVGILDEPAKFAALAASTLFVLPSISEGFSTAVIEALGCGVPVIVTKGCHVPEVALSGAGVVIERDEHELRDALLETFSLSSQELAARGARGKKLVADRNSFETLGRQWTEVYKWLLGGNRPDSVEIV